MHTRHHPRFSQDTKNLVLAETDGPKWSHKKRTLSVRQLSELPEAPARSTIYSWKKQNLDARGAVAPKKKMGRPCMLSEGEQLVLGGFCLSRLEKGRPCGLKQLRVFAWESFGEPLSDSILSRYMSKLRFRSHSAEASNGYFGEASREAGVQIIQTVRNWVLDRLEGTSRVVFEDEMTVWDQFTALRTYSPIGRFVFPFFASTFFF